MLIIGSSRRNYVQGSLYAWVPIAFMSLEEGLVEALVSTSSQGV
jgi:hypothetical protein